MFSKEKGLLGPSCVFKAISWAVCIGVPLVVIRIVIEYIYEQVEYYYSFWSLLDGLLLTVVSSAAIVFFAGLGYLVAMWLYNKVK